jgi:hypothetical protein
MVELDEFAGLARTLVTAVAEHGDSVMVVQDGAPVALLLAPGTQQSQAVLTDLPRWEEWIREFRESFAHAGDPQPAPQASIPARASSVPMPAATSWPASWPGSACRSATSSS